MEKVIGLIPYIPYIFWGITALCVLGGLFFGFRKGWKQSFLKLFLCLLSIVLAAALAPLLYKLILDLRLGLPVPEGFEPSIRGFAESKANEVLAGIVTVSPALIAFFLSLPAIFINLVVFILLFLILRLVFRFTLFPIGRRLLGDKRARKRGKKKGRLLGAGVGVVQGLALALAFLVPFGAFANAANTLHTNLKLEAFQELAENNPEDALPKTITDLDTLLKGFSDGYLKSPGGWFNALGLDRLIYNHLTVTDIGGGKTISLADTSVAIAKVVNIATFYKDFLGEEGGVDFEKALSDAPKMAELGKALDEFFELKVLEPVLDTLFTDLLEPMLAGAAGDAFDLSGVHLRQVKFESAIPVMFRGYQMFSSYGEWKDEGDGYEKLGDKFGEFIDAAKGMLNEEGNDPSGIIRAFEKMIENVMAGMNISEQIDGDYFSDPDNQINLVDSKVELVNMVKLAGRGGTITDVISGTAETVGDAELQDKIDKVNDVKGKLIPIDDSDTSVKKIANIYMGELMGTTAVNPVGAFISGCDAYIFMLKMTNNTQTAGITSGNIGDMIAALEDPVILQYALNSLGGGNVNLSGESNAEGTTNSAEIEAQLNAKLTGDPENDDKYYQMAAMFGVTLTPPLVGP